MDLFRSALVSDLQLHPYYQLATSQTAGGVPERELHIRPGQAYNLMAGGHQHHLCRKLGKAIIV